MKISGYVLVVLAIGFCFALVGSIITDMQTQYPDVEINKSWESKYNFESQIKSNATLTQRSLEKMRNSDSTGWKVFFGTLAIPAAVLDSIIMVLASLIIGGAMLTGVGTDIGIPQFVISFSITALTVIIIYGLISFWRKYKA